jgi:hypothetical protein
MVQARQAIKEAGHTKDSNSFRDSGEEEDHFLCSIKGFGHVSYLNLFNLIYGHSIRLLYSYVNQCFP